MANQRTRPILFSAPMVRAILEGRKSQTRRIVKPQPGASVTQCYPRPDGHFAWCLHTGHGVSEAFACPYGAPGDLFWVRETWCPIYPQDPNYNGGEPIEIDYRATPTERMSDHLGTRKWKPSIHMPRSASRITLQVTGVRVERLHEISPEDAAAEGWPGPDEANTIASAYPIAWYSRLWDEINGRGAYNTNPWVWVISFERVADNAGAAA